jgi:hypothetical protein
MNKAQLDLCREVLALFNKATFTVTGVELLQNAQKLSIFAKMITDEEGKLGAIPAPVAPPMQLTAAKGKR